MTAPPDRNDLPTLSTLRLTPDEWTLAIAAAEARGLRMAEKLVRDKAIGFGSDGTVLRPRVHGDQSGLAYADAIAALLPPPADGGDNG